MSSPIDPPAGGGARYATASLGAHLLTSAGSELSRAADLLELAGWRDPEIIQTIRAVLERVQGVRLVVDSRLQEAAYMARGLAVPGHVRDAIALGEGMLSP